MYVVIAVFFEEKRTHLVILHGLIFFIMEKWIFGQIFVLVFIWMIMIIVDDWSNVFFMIFLILELGLQAHQFSFHFLLFFSFLSRKISQMPKNLGVYHVGLFMKVRRAELYDLISPNTMGEKYFLKEHSWFFNFPNRGCNRVFF